MDTRRSRLVARDGPRLRDYETSEKKSMALGGVASRSPNECPYGLGVHCPVVEVIQSIDFVKKPLSFWNKAIPALLGIIVSTLLIGYFYF